MTSEEKTSKTVRRLRKMGYGMGDVVAHFQKERATNIRHTDGKKADCEQSLEERVSNILRELRIPPQNKGYGYLRTAIMMVYNNPEDIILVTKVLYPKVAKQYGATASNVERNIRTEIEISWSKADPEVLEKYLGYSGLKKPSNSEFIACIADLLFIQDNK